MGQPREQGDLQHEVADVGVRGRCIPDLLKIQRRVSLGPPVESFEQGYPIFSL